MATTIRRIGPGDDDALADYVRIRNTVAPESTDSLEQIAWQGKAYPGQGARFLALDADGNAVGTATTGRIWMYGPEFERYWLGIWVLPHARGLGLGSALYDGGERAWPERPARPASRPSCPRCTRTDTASWPIAGSWRSSATRWSGWTLRACGRRTSGRPPGSCSRPWSSGRS